VFSDQEQCVDVLQTLVEIGVENNTTVVFPLPIELANLLSTRAPTGPAPG
jgi:hypothetical protein